MAFLRSKVAGPCGAVLLGVALVAAPALAAQDPGTVTGRITDARSGQPVPSVQVYISGLDVGVLTQQNGRYLLQNVPAGSFTVTAERIGYRSVAEEATVESGGTAVLDLEITEEALRLDEVIVTGTPGGAQRRAIGNSVATVEASELTDRLAITNMQEMLSARTPGVNFSRLSGNVGTGSAIQVRGFSSLELGSQPLVYVDGVRVNNASNAGAYTRGGGQASVLDDFAPGDIESIEIIKGPAAATLYGTEASAGVIQIITKRGQAGAPQFDLTVRQGLNFMTDPAGRIGDQWACEGGISQFFGTCAEENLIRFNLYEHEKRVHGNDVYGYGRSQGYDLSVRGGTDAVRYFLSASWSDDTGVVDYNWNQSLGLRGNVSLVVSEELTVDVSTGYTDGDSRFAQPHPGEGGIWEEMIFAQGHELDEPLRGFQDRLPKDVATVENTREYARFTGSVTATHNYSEWLTQRLVVGLDRSWDQNSLLVPRHLLGADGPYDGESEGRASLENPRTTQTTVDYSASGTYRPGETFSFTTSVGAQYYFREREEIENEGRVFTSPLIRDIAGATQFENPDHNFSQSKTFGLYVQEQLGINDRIYLTAAVRGDDSSTFGSSFDLIYYPKFSGTWVISEESFWGVDFVNSLRLRAAWGQSGRQPGAFASHDLFVSYPGPGGSAAIAPFAAGNREVGPEVSSEIEAGFDFALWNDRVSGEFTYFQQEVEDALVDQDQPPSAGYAFAIDANLGAMENWGWEAALDLRIVETDAVSFDLAFAGDHSDNEVTFLGEQILEDANFRLGLPFPNVASNVVVSAELDEFGQATNIMCDGGTGPVGLHRGGEPVPCSEVADRELLLGRAFPTYTWSVAPTLTLFDDLQVFALMEGQYGRWMSNLDLAFRNFYRNTRKDLLRDDPLYVAAYRTSGIADDRYQGRFNADFWKLREIGARYRLPEAWVQRTGADRASIAISAREIAYLWRRQTHDLAGNKIPDHEIVNPVIVGVAPNFSLGQMPGLSKVSVMLRVSF